MIHLAANSAGVSRRQMPWRVLIGLTTAVIASAGGWWNHMQPAARASRLLAEARGFRFRGESARAEHAAAAAWQLNPDLAEAAMLAAGAALAQDKLHAAIGYALQLKSPDPWVQSQALLFAAKLNHERLYRLADAERTYRAALVLAPDDREANTGLVNLLALCGRTREAVPHILRLIRLGAATDMLVLLSRPDGVVNDQAALERARRADPADPNPLLGSAWHEASAEKFSAALALVAQAVELAPNLLAAHVAQGTLLLAAGQFDELAGWAAALPPAANDFAEAWLVRGRMAEHQGNAPGAIRCYGEALRRAPELKTANFRLARLLAEAGNHAAASRFSRQLQRLQNLEMLQNRILFSHAHDDLTPLLELIDAYRDAGRLWEACGWCQLAAQSGDVPPRLRRRLAELTRAVADMPLQLTANAANPALACDFSAYPLPQPRRPAPAATAAVAPRLRRLAFRNDAAATGLKFRYFNGTAGPPARRMYEFTGGGIGVLDFDCDGFADVFCTQGCPWPPTRPSPAPATFAPGDRLFRNQDGADFADVSDFAGIHEHGFGQGVAAGDFNADGFPDLYVANIGENLLWQNNGDGTFADMTTTAGIAGNEWTTSTVLADFNGDGLPDIYAVNYLEGLDLFDRVCTHPDGAPKICMPFDFDGQPDRLWLNAGDGRFTDAAGVFFRPTAAGKGLGAAAWDAAGTGRLSLLVANDTTPNFWFEPAGAGDNPPGWRERGMETGLALNGAGQATGCMGIALGDLNDDGLMDVAITNFFGESATLYLSRPGGQYEDRARETGLHALTGEQLGFGAQFLDADLDGWLELFMANGHIDDWRAYGKPYHMPAQLLRWTGRRFDPADAHALGPFFEQDWLGRAVARFDWNRDGRDDLLVGLLDDEMALLTNAPPDSGRYLSLKLFGVQSNRDAIGATAMARVGGRTLVRQLTAGDGYQATNERRLIFGLGDAKQIDELVVRWPSGLVQRFNNIATPGELWLIEGRPPCTPP